MAPHEFRICATPDPARICTWDVEVWMRDITDEENPEQWRCVHRVQAMAPPLGRSSQSYFRDILKACKV